jgi:hypothetical protein
MAMHLVEQPAAAIVLLNQVAEAATVVLSGTGSRLRPAVSCAHAANANITKDRRGGLSDEHCGFLLNDRCPYYQAIPRI